MIWAFTSGNSDKMENKFRILPDYTASLIFTSSPEKNSKKIYITGPNKFPVNIIHSTGQITFGFRFNPMILPLMLKYEPEISVNKILALDEIIGSAEAEKLSDEFYSSDNINSKIFVVEKFLKGKDFRADIINSEIKSVIEKIVDTGGTIKLEEIYQTVNSSPRQFQRIFSAKTGISPKEFCKIVRFHTVANKLVKNNFKHYDALVETGFYDQSHYYREFKEFIGMLPKVFEFRQKRISHKNLLK